MTPSPQMLAESTSALAVSDQEKPPTDYPIRLRIIEAAQAAFRQQGYRINIASIAKQAGVARQTLYNHFTSKDELFAEAVRGVCSKMMVHLTGKKQLRQSLIEFGLSIRTLVLDQQRIANIRILISESEQFPELPKLYLNNGPESLLQELATYLQQAMSTGELRQDSPRFAAEMLHNMLLGYEHTKLLLSANDSPTKRSAEQEREQVKRIVDCFLTAFAVTKGTEI